MKLKLIAAAITLLALNACTEPLTPEERAEQTARNLPLPTAAIPDCVSTALGQNGNYSKLVALGYENYKPITKSGVNFRGKEGSVLLGDKTTLNFQKGIGCEAEYSNETDDFNVIGAAWISALKNAGYEPSTNGGQISFVANGVPMRFDGNHRVGNYSNVMAFSIKRGDR